MWNLEFIEDEEDRRTYVEAAKEAVSAALAQVEYGDVCTRCCYYNPSCTLLSFRRCSMRRTGHLVSPLPQKFAASKCSTNS